MFKIPVERWGFFFVLSPVIVRIKKVQQVKKSVASIKNHDIIYQKSIFFITEFFVDKEQKNGKKAWTSWPFKEKVIKFFFQKTTEK